jgi:23S rRNA (uracil1939-C5)-methyltransferase
VQVDCPHLDCDGCLLVRLPYVDQLAFKRDQVTKAFAPYPTLNRARRQPVRAAAEPTGYRRRVKLAVRQQGSTAAAGLFRRGSRELQPIPDCPVTHPRLRDTTRAVMEVLGQHAACVPDGPVKVLDLRLGEGERNVALTLVLDRAEATPDDLPLDALREACPELRTLALNLNPGGSPLALGRQTEVVWGEPRTEVSIGERCQWLSPGVFFQTHVEQTEAIHGILRGFFAGAPTGRRLLDLYCGAGTHSFALADLFEQVTGVEANEDAIGDARFSASQLGLDHVAFEVRNAAAVDAELLSGGWHGVVLNPPRGGVPAALRDALAENPPTRLAYISCNPWTLSRDLDHLVRRGFRPRDVVPVDMMPLTDHVECVVLLEHVDGTRDEGDRPPRRRHGREMFLRLHPFGPQEIGLPDIPGLPPRWQRDDSTRLYPCLPRDASGVARVVLRGAAEDGSYTAIALLLGGAPEHSILPAPLLRQAGAPSGGVVDVRRLAPMDSHSLVRLRVSGVPLESLRRAMRSFGHPIIGDRAHGLRPVNHYFSERYGLDRAFLHVSQVDADTPPGVRSWTLAADLQAVVAQAGVSVDLEPRARGERTRSPSPPPRRKAGKRRNRRGR